MNKFDPVYIRQWHSNYWYISLIISFFYLVIIFSVKKWMNSRLAFKLDGLLFVWNLSLAFFSLIGCIQLNSALFSILLKSGIYVSLCDNSFDVNTQRWLWLFTWSKVIELGDTFFVIFRKRKLIPLHWLHHTLTLCLCFFYFSEMQASSLWGASMNLFVHTYMYTYYAFKSLRVSISKSISMLITFSQIVQMLIGITIHMLILYYKNNGTHCTANLHVVQFVICFYIILLFLFADYFFKAYLSCNSISTKLKDS